MLSTHQLHSGIKYITTFISLPQLQLRSSWWSWCPPVRQEEAAE